MTRAHRIASKSRDVLPLLYRVESYLENPDFRDVARHHQCASAEAVMTDRDVHMGLVWAIAIRLWVSRRAWPMVSFGELVTG